jgi:hypothetical protein
MTPEIMRQVEHRLVKHPTFAQQTSDQKAPDAPIAVELRVGPRSLGNRLFLLLIIPRIAELLARSGNLPAALGSFREMLEDSGGSRDLISVTYGLGNLIVLLSGSVEGQRRRR